MLPQALVITLSLAIAVSAAQIQSANPSFTAAGIQGCVSVQDNVDGAPVTIHDCNRGDSATYDWEVNYLTSQPATSQQIKIHGNKCLDVKDGANKDGTDVQIWTCNENNANQQWVWNLDSTFRWGNTNKCLDLRDGRITDGTPLQIWTCNGGSNQAWVSGRVDLKSDHVRLAISDSKVLSPLFCVTASSNNFDAPVGLADCENFQATYPKGNITWNVPSVHTSGFVSIFDGKCLTVPGSNKSNGVKLTTQACLPRAANQRFTSRPNAQIEWEGTGFCLDLTDGKSTNGNLIQIWECDNSGNNVNQRWARVNVPY
ncbi:hypothetical protein MIND_00974700 [Mycena indigotica]|uniref:Ricin B lectin domain-containing protein n=1 Tax=Mycena indigotica TaxID=2126181 RepID=A0A8H6SD95_9AGAR|nr:uncharacterized protein MIND_00974700 [Mycena indigotica]KAF7297411.1 hypothetical protein MIND_00974700 [Mycena indigotica]